MVSLELAEALHARRGFGQVDRYRLSQAFNSMKDDPRVFMDFGPESGIVGMLTRPVGAGVMIAQELAWFAQDGKGIQRLRAFENWAARHDIEAIQVTTEPGKDLSRMGYRLHSLGWQK